MIETLKSIILDFQEVELETGVPRRLKIRAAPDKATVCIGVRRSGKSTYLFQMIKRLLDDGVKAFARSFQQLVESIEMKGNGAHEEG